MMISGFEQWLRSRTNKQKRTFHEDTILAYAKAARALDTWMTEHDVDGDFTTCDTGHRAGHCAGDGRVPAGAEVPPAGRITVRLAGAAQQRPA